MVKKISVKEHSRVGTAGVKAHNRTLADVSMGKSQGTFNRTRKKNMTWDEIAMRELGKREDTKFEEASYDEFSRGKNIEGEDGSEYVIFENYDDAEYSAEDRVREDLEDSPEMFNQEWLQDFMTMSETDRRMLSQEESDNQVDNMSDREVKDSNVYDDDNEDEDDAIDNAREELRGNLYDEIYESLSDPYNYFVEEQGIYSREDFFNSGLVSLDIDDAVEDAIRTDGVAHFLNHYDGNEITLPSGAYAYRRN